MFLPDGDLYTDGQGRTRHFRWRGIDENSQFDLFGNKGLWGDEEAEAVELSTEEEIQRRKERYEREAFLREEMVSFRVLLCLCIKIHMKMSSAGSFIFMQIKVILALRLVLKQGHKGIRNGLFWWH